VARGRFSILGTFRRGFPEIGDFPARSITLLPRVAQSVEYMNLPWSAWGFCLTKIGITPEQAEYGWTNLTKVIFFI
jgi:hypothetical protein